MQCGEESEMNGVQSYEFEYRSNMTISVIESLRFSGFLSLIFTPFLLSCL